MPGSWIACETSESVSEPLRRPRIALVTEAVNDGLRDHRDRRMNYAADPVQLTQILRAGNALAAAVADKTLAEVRQVMTMDY